MRSLNTPEIPEPEEIPSSPSPRKKESKTTTDESQGSSATNKNKHPAMRDSESFQAAITPRPRKKRASSKTIQDLERSK